MTERGYGEGSVYRRSVDGRWYGALDVASGTRGRVSGAPNGLQLGLHDGLHSHAAAVIAKASALINKCGP